MIKGDQGVLALVFRGRPFSFLALISTSASDLLALTSWTILRNCLMAMTGKLALTRTHGQNESILLARAISSAAAL